MSGEYNQIRGDAKCQGVPEVEECSGELGGGASGQIDRGMQGAETHLLADSAEDAGCHGAEAIEHLEERDDGQNGGDKLDHLCRSRNTWSALSI